MKETLKITWVCDICESTQITYNDLRWSDNECDCGESYVTINNEKVTKYGNVVEVNVEYIKD
jgi:hypothetical protein